MNTDFSPSFTVSYVYFVPELQQSVSHLHRLSGVDGVNESVCASLFFGEQRQCAVTSEQANAATVEPMPDSALSLQEFLISATIAAFLVGKLEIM